MIPPRLASVFLLVLSPLCPAGSLADANAPAGGPASHAPASHAPAPDVPACDVPVTPAGQGKRVSDEKSPASPDTPAASPDKLPAPSLNPAAVRPLAQAHAHNDYEHARPLLDALDCGFMGVEADIYLVGGQLLVAHNPEDVKPERTLQALYLKPLAERAARGGGRIYPGAGAGAVTLLIDIKDGASTTWAALKPVLEEFRDILTEFDGKKLQERAVTVILSGNVPAAELAAIGPRLAFIDGRPQDLEKNPPATLVPWISSSWSALFKWRGQGEFPEDQKKRLLEFIAKAHAQGRRVRFWGVYDEPFAWDILRHAGVDVLGSDNLPGLRDYLLKAEAPSH